MNIAYFVPLYPAVSLTFIIREIRELEKGGSSIVIFSFEQADMDFVQPEFSESKAQVFYPPRLRSWQIAKVLWANLSVALVNPGGYFKALKRMQVFPYAKLLARFGLFLQTGYFSYLAQKLSVERIHAHFAIDWAIVAMLTSWMADLPFSITTHAGDIFVNPHPDIVPLLFSEADILVTISEFNRKFLLASFPDVLQPECVFVVHCGVDIGQFDFMPPSSPTGHISIITVARLVGKKGHSTVIEALQLLKQQNIHFSWIVVGRGPLLSKLQELVKQKKLEDNVEFVGAATRDEVQIRLRNSNVMVLPCIKDANGDMDGIPVVLIEAMAMGIPVISTDISGIPELITHRKSGLLVTPGDSMALANALKQVFEESSVITQMAVEARRKVVDDFNIETEGLRLLDIFQESSYSTKKL